MSTVFRLAGAILGAIGGAALAGYLHDTAAGGEQDAAQGEAKKKESGK